MSTPPTRAPAGRQPEDAPVVVTHLLDEAPAPGDGRAWFVTLELTTGTLAITHDAGEGVPWLVSALWALRWPIAGLPTDRANKLLDTLAPDAQRLVDSARTGLPDGRRPGAVFHGGAGLAIDAITRRCAATWTDPIPWDTSESPPHRPEKETRGDR